MGSGPNNPEKEASPANVSHAKLMLCNPESQQFCTNAEFIRHFSFVLTINLCVMLTVKGLCSEVGYGLRALGASLRIADRGGVLKGKAR